MSSAAILFLRSFNLFIVFLSFTFYFANIQHRFEVLKELLFSSPLESFLFRYLFSIRFISKSVTRSDCQGFCILLGVKVCVRIPHIVYIICSSLRFFFSYSNILARKLVQFFSSSPCTLLRLPLSCSDSFEIFNFKQNNRINLDYFINQFLYATSHHSGYAYRVYIVYWIKVRLFNIRDFGDENWSTRGDKMKTKKCDACAEILNYSNALTFHHFFRRHHRRKHKKMKKRDYPDKWVLSRGIF